MKHSFAVMSHSGEETTVSTRKNKKLILVFFSSLLIVAAVIGTVVGVKNKNKNKNDDNSAGHAIIKSSCSVTSYPDLCLSSLTGTKLSGKVTSQKDVIMLALNITFLTVEHNYFHVKKLMLKKGLTKREKIALHDCLEMVDETLDELREAEEELKEYDPSKKGLSEHADNLMTLVSSAITNVETCFDGFSSDEADK